MIQITLNKIIYGVLNLAVDEAKQWNFFTFRNQGVYDVVTFYALVALDELLLI